MSFTTRIYHPYINDNGIICCDFLYEHYTAVWTIPSRIALRASFTKSLTLILVLLAIQSLLSDFNDLDHAIRPDAAAVSLR
jgi:ubiquitin-protein ligase